MPTNYRLYYPIEAVFIGAQSTASGAAVHGVQSVTLTTNFSLEQVFELGQLNIYENIENVPDIEISIEKVLDGYPLVYHMSTRGSTSSALSIRSNQRADVSLSLFSDSQENASGTPLKTAYCSGMYVNSLTYRLPVQGNCTEAVTLIGNDKQWSTGSPFAAYQFTGSDAPAATDGVQRRQEVVMGSGVGVRGSVWPTIIPGITTGSGSGYNIETAGLFGANIQDVEISTSLGREDLFELGRRKPYYRYANFPTSVTCTINITNAGTNPGDNVDALSSVTSNLTDQAILINLADGTSFNLGTKNKLQSITFTPGPATGGVGTTAYTFENFNILKVVATSDPDGLS